MELYNHQKRFLANNPNKHMLVHDTGTGKTFTSIKWADLRKPKHVVLICPKALKQNWSRNVVEHSLFFERWTLLTKEEFKKHVKSLEPADVVIVDEAHHFAGTKSQLSKALYYYNKKHEVQNILLLTATPYRSTPWDIYILAKHLGIKWSYMGFKKKFFTEAYIPGYNRYIPKIRKGIEPAIAKLVATFGDVVKLEECVDVPEQVFETEYFTLTKEQIEGKKLITDINPIVRYTAYHEIENGFLMSDGYEEAQLFSCEKNERLLELAETHDKIAIVARYNVQLDQIAKLLGHLKKPIFVIRGNVKDRDAVVQQVEKAKECVVLIQAQCSEGYELPSIGLMVFASLSFSYVDYKQMCGRILRINKLKKNVYLHLVSGGMDTDVFGAIQRKQSFDIEIYARENNLSV